eukprot:635251_1
MSSPEHNNINHHSPDRFEPHSRSRSRTRSQSHSPDDGSVNGHMATGSDLDEHISQTFPVFVRNLPTTLNDQDLHDLFEECGGVDSCSVVQDKVTGESKGYAFVNFLTDASRQKALEMSDRSVQGHRVHIEIANDRSTIFLGGLSNAVSEEEFRRFVKKVAGPWVEFCYHKSYAFVRFRDHKSAVTALNILEKDIMMNGNILNVEFASRNSDGRRTLRRDGPLRRGERSVRGGGFVRAFIQRILIQLEKAEILKGNSVGRRMTNSLRLSPRPTWDSKTFNSSTRSH